MKPVGKTNKIRAVAIFDEPSVPRSDLCSYAFSRRLTFIEEKRILFPIFRCVSALKIKNIYGNFRVILTLYNINIYRL